MAKLRPDENFLEEEFGGSLLSGLNFLFFANLREPLKERSAIFRGD